MAIKIQVIRENIVMTNTLTSEVIFEHHKLDLKCDFLMLKQGYIKLNDVDFQDNLVTTSPRIKFEDAVDFQEVPFTEASFLHFARTRLGLQDDFDYRAAHAEDIIFKTYGDVVSIRDKDKNLLKFGVNRAVGTDVTGYTLWATGLDLANEVYLADSVNAIDTISSSSVSDVGVLVSLEGHTDVGGIKTFVIQSAVLNGQNKVVLTTPLNRLTRISNIDNVELVGAIYGYEDTAISAGKPTDVTKIHITIPAGKQQSRKCATALSDKDYWIITGFTSNVLNKTPASAEITIEVRERGGVFRELAILSASNNHSGNYDGSSPYLVAPRNSDVRLRAVGSSAGTEVAGTISGYLAAVL